MFANLAKATTQIQNDELLKTTNCAKLKNYDENETNEFLYCRRQRSLLALLSSCDLAHLSQAYKRISIFKFYLKSHFYEVASNR